MPWVSTLARMTPMGTLGSVPGLKTDDPATIMLAPALAAASTVLGPRPPSTWMSSAGCSVLISSTLGIMLGIKDWPPKPGSTVMTSTMSTRATMGATAPAGVPGFSATPTFMPAARMALQSSAAAPSASPAASMWKVYWLPPASLMGSIHCSGLETIMWQSKKTSAGMLLRRLAMTGGPQEMFGQKLPSMMSKWMESAPASITLRASSPRLARSLASIEGPMLHRQLWCMHCHTPSPGIAHGGLQARRAGACAAKITEHL